VCVRACARALWFWEVKSVSKMQIPYRLQYVIQAPGE